MLTYKPPLLNDHNPDPQKVAKREQALALIKQELENTARMNPNGQIQLVISGDGGMLQAMKDHKNDDVIFFGLNAGTVGFLTNDMRTSHFPKSLDELTIIDVPIIETTITKKTGEIIESYFINDVLLNESAANYHRFTVTSKTKGHLIDIFGSSLLINTPLGSTGQALNADVPLLDIRSKLWGVSGSYLKGFKWGYLQPDEITITDTRGRDPRHIYHDGKNPATIVHDVESITLHPPKKYLKLGFKNDEDYNDRRVLLAQESLGNVLLGKNGGILN